VELSAGVVVSDYSIVRSGSAPEGPYIVDFQAAGRQYSCALPYFLPRTQSLPAENPA
jgi:hypothetical protein